MVKYMERIGRERPALLIDRVRRMHGGIDQAMDRRVNTHEPNASLSITDPVMAGHRVSHLERHEQRQMAGSVPYQMHTSYSAKEKSSAIPRKREPSRSRRLYKDRQSPCDFKSKCGP